MKTNTELNTEIQEHNKKQKSFFNKVKNLFLKGEFFTKRFAPNNWNGVPKQNLTWKEVSSKTLCSIMPMALDIEPNFCPLCQMPLKKYKSDWWKIEDSGQFMVTGVFCEKGHYTHLDWA